MKERKKSILETIRKNDIMTMKKNGYVDEKIFIYLYIA